MCSRRAGGLPPPVCSLARLGGPARDVLLAAALDRVGERVGGRVGVRAHAALEALLEPVVVRRATTVALQWKSAADSICTTSSLLLP